MGKLNVYIDELSLLTDISNIKINSHDLEEFVNSTEQIVGFQKISNLYRVENIYEIIANGRTIGETVSCNIPNGSYRDLLIRLMIILDRAMVPTDNNHVVISPIAAIKYLNGGCWISHICPSKADWWDSDRMVWITKANTVVNALRDLTVKTHLSISEINDFAPTLFDSLYFYAPASDIKKTKLDYTRTLPKLFDHLAYLNDCAYDDFDKNTQSIDRIAVAGSKNIDISPESSKTRRNSVAIRERNVSVGNKVYCCEWHSKLEATHGRIHFYVLLGEAARPAVLKGIKVIIGIIAYHLS